MKLAQLSSVGIAILCIALLQRGVPPTTLAAPELSGLNETRNGSFAINSSSSSSSLPDPSNCDSAKSTAIDRFFFVNSSEQLATADARNGEQRHASNLSDAQNSTHHLHDSAVSQNLFDCQDKSSSSADDNGSVEEQNDDLVSKGTELTSTGMMIKDSVEVLAPNGKDGTTDDDDDDVAMVNMEQIGRRAVPSNTATHITAGHIPDVDDVLVVNKRRLSGPTPPPTDSSIHTAAQRSAAKSSVQMTDFPKEETGFIDAERLGRRTPPPGSPSIHTAAGSSVARESVVTN